MIGYSAWMGDLASSPWQDAQVNFWYAALPASRSAACAAPARARPPAKAISRFFMGSLTLLESRIVGSHVGHVLLGQCPRDGLHGGEGARPAGVFLECSHDILGVLARDHGDVIELGIGGLVAQDAMAADAHRDLTLCGLHVTLDRLGIGRQGL